MKDLKPCPFCKGDAKIEHSYREDDHRYPRDFWHARVVCVDECGMEREWICYGRQENENNDPVAKSEIEEILITEWNRRPIEDALRAEIDALLFEWNLMVKTIGAKTHGTAIGEAGQIVRERDALRAEIAVKDEQIAKLSESLHLARQLAQSAHEVAELAWGGSIPSPLPGHRHQTEDEFFAEMERLNCPLCGGSGHVDDADQAMVAKIKGLEAKVQRLEAVRVAAEDAVGGWDGGRDCHCGYMEALEQALQAVPSDEPATSYGVAVNEAGSGEQQAAGDGEA